MDDERYFVLFCPRHAGEGELAWLRRCAEEEADALRSHDPPIDPETGAFAVHAASVVTSETQ